MSNSTRSCFRKGRYFLAAAALLGLSSVHATLAPAQAAPVRAGAAFVRLPGSIPALVQRSALVGAVDTAQTIHIALVLPLRNQSSMQDLLHSLYDPKDPLYGHYLTSAQFDAQFGPTNSDYQAAIAYAQANGLTVTHQYNSHTLLDLTGTAADVEQTFGVDLLQYQSPADGRVYRAPNADPAIPASLAGVVVGVLGLDTATVMKPLYQTAPAGADMLNPLEIGTGVDNGLSPTDIRTAYNLNTVSANGTGQSLGLYELDGYVASDITAYEDNYGLPHVPLINTYIDGNTGELQASGGQGEVSLDIELQAAIAPDASNIYVYEADNGTTGMYDEWTQIAADNLAKEISVSWGSSEYSGETTSDPGVTAEHNAAVQMAMQGQSVYVAAGDSGSYANGSSLSVSSYASDPEITAVGGTSLSVNNGETYQSETTWNNLSFDNGAGGGGISTIWPIPGYQTGAVGSDPEASTTMRNLPDVSLDANPETGYSFYSGGAWGDVGGTSCAAPLWAAFTALVNQVRSDNNETPATIGFINPTIYNLCEGNFPYNASQYGNDFHDIADDSNNSPVGGLYHAVTGFDDATGWGTFNGANLLTDLASLSAQSDITSLTINATAAAPGDVLTGTITVADPAPTGGSIIDLSSSDLAAISVPATVTVPQGATTVTFAITATNTPVRRVRNVTITASNALYSQSATVTALPYAITGLTLSAPSAVSGATTETGTVTLSNSTTAATSITLSAVAIVNGKLSPSTLLPITVPTTLTVPANASQVTFTIGVDDTGATTIIQLTAEALNGNTGLPYQLLSGTDAQTQSLTILPAAFTSLTLTNPVNGGGAGTGTVTLNGTAPPGGAVITLSTQYTGQISVPTSVTVLQGTNTAQFTFNAYAIGNPATVAITASYLGISQTAQTMIVPTGTPGLTFSPDTIGPGVQSTGTITVGTPAAPGGLPVGLSSDSAAVSLPASVVILGGQTSATFTVTGNSVPETTTANITPSINGVAQPSVPLTVTPPVVSGVSVSPASVIGTQTATGKVTLSAVAPADSGGGMIVTLLSNNTAAVAVPTTVLVPTGSSTATFPITTLAVSSATSVQISATGTTGGAQTTSLTVTPPTVTALTLTPTAVFGGNASTGTVTLSEPAPTGGLTVNVESSNTASATVPATVTVAAGETTATFPITTLAVAATVTISASTDASFPASPVGATQSALLTVSTVGFTLSVSPSTVSLGAPATGTITLSGPAPTGGLTMYLQVYNPIAGAATPASVPNTVTIAAGATTATFPVTTLAVSTGTSVTLSASASSTFPTGATQSTTLTIAASGVSVSLAASTSVAGTPVTGTVTLSGPAPAGGATISLASSNASAASVPSTVTVAAGATSATFQVSTYSAAAGVVITATTPQGQSGTASVTVTANSGYSYAGGWDLISLPYDYSNLTPAQIFGFSTATLFQWSPMSLQYVTTAATTTDAVHPGIGYWVYLPQGGQVTAVGTPTDTTQPFSVAVLPGWNMIGDPFTTSVSVSSLTATVNTSVYPYGSASSLLPALYGYTPGASGAVGNYNLIGSSGTLSSGQGYWLYATQSLTLTFPAPNPVSPAPPVAPSAR